MLDLILQLLDRCISLVKEKNKNNKELFINIVEPIQKDFEKVHTNYLNTFQKYRALMDEIEHPVPSDSILYKTMREDSVFSYCDRTKLNLLKRYSQHTIFSSYVKEIRAYIILSDDFLPTDGITTKLEGNPEDILNENLRMNSPRYWTIEQIIKVQKEQGLRKNEYKDLAIIEIDRMVLRLQQHYEKVYTEYINLRDTLLNCKLLK